MRSLILTSLLTLAAAAPNTPPPNPLVAAGLAAAPLMHADDEASRLIPSKSVTKPTRASIYRREFDIGGVLDDIFSTLGDIPSYVASGIPNFFQDLPQGGDVLDKLGLKDDDMDAKPTQVLNIPGYANWTDKGWNLLVHGQVYKDPELSKEKLNDLANVFLVDTSIEDLQPSEAQQARNLTREIFSVPESDANVTMTFVPNFVAPTGLAGGLVAAKGGAQVIVMPDETTEFGDFSAFVPLANTTIQSGGNTTHLEQGNLTANIQALNYYAGNATLGNATAYLVPPVGFTIISDIDDILRVTKIYKPAEGLLNSFARAFTPWMNMPEVYADWARRIPDLHYHYLTTTPEQATPNYMDFIYKTYPLGSFDTRPLNFSDVKATLSIRKFLLNRIFETYPERKFILVGDTSNSDIMDDYPALVNDFPNQVACIWLRNVTTTDGDEFKFPYNTKGFKDLNNQQYMFFNTPDDLKGLDFVNGECRNKTVADQPTFDYQNVPFQDSATCGGQGALAMAGMMAIAAAVMNL